MRGLSARGVSVVLAVVTLVLAVQWFQLSGKVDRQAARLDHLYGQAKKLEKAAAASKQVADSLQRHYADLSLHPIHSLHVGFLRRRGLAAPVDDLVEDLRRHPELISQEPVLGGRMAFESVHRIRVLSEAWVYAPHSDGHVGGDGLYEYQVSMDGKITWREVASRGH